MSEHTYPQLADVEKEVRSLGDRPMSGPTGSDAQPGMGRTAAVLPSQSRVRPRVADRLRLRRPAEPIPAMVPDPFDDKQLLPLTAAPQLGFNLVDGTVAIATDPQMPFILF